MALLFFARSYGRLWFAVGRPEGKEVQETSDRIGACRRSDLFR